MIAVAASDKLSVRDPNALCQTCGIRGTIALFEHDAPPHAVERYCDACWPARRDALDAAGVHGGWEVLSWRFVEEFVAVVEDGIIANRAQGQMTPAQEAALPAQLRHMAADIVQHAADYDGSMPSRVAQFITLHHRPAA